MNNKLNLVFVYGVLKAECRKGCRTGKGMQYVYHGIEESQERKEKYHSKNNRINKQRDYLPDFKRNKDEVKYHLTVLERRYKKKIARHSRIISIMISIGISPEEIAEKKATMAYRTRVFRKKTKTNQKIIINNLN